MKKKINASITIFLSLSISAFLILIMTLSKICIIGSEKLRFEIASDISCNSALGEYGKLLFEKYDLLYIDTSYLGKVPQISNLENRIMYYLKENSEEIYKRTNSPWGNMRIDKVNVSAIESACASEGMNMSSQIMKYVDDSNHTQDIQLEVNEAALSTDFASGMDNNNPFEIFYAYKEAVDSIPLPQKKINNKLIEVPVSNPADWVYGLSGSDILYLAKAKNIFISEAIVDLSSLISKRGAENTYANKNVYEYEETKYISYLVDKFSSYMDEKEESILKLQLEYIVSGKESDYMNFMEVVNRIYKWRLCENLDLAFGNPQIIQEAYAEAMLLEVCSLNPAFIEPVRDSIVAACAYLETVNDMYSILNGGNVSFPKEELHTSVFDVTTGNIRYSLSDVGLSYRQYLEVMLLLLDPETKIYRTMDLIEMEIRHETGNNNFMMDWCIESFDVDVNGSGSGVKEYKINRKYGYF